MAAGIGEASAIIGIAQVGFSLAKTLNSYVSEVRDAQEDVLELISDIDSTFSQLQDLGKLIEQNETTKAWSENGVKLARKCVTDCEKVIAKMRKLLKKSTASAASDQVTRDEIDVKKLEKALWPLYKPELLVRKQELRSIKQDILIAYATYNLQAGVTEVDRQRAKDDLPGLSKTRAILQKQVKEAKSQRQSHRARRRPLPKATSGRGPAAEYASSRVPRTPSDTGLEEGVIYDCWDDVEADFEMWREEEELSKKRLADELRAVETKAVEKWRKSQAEEVEARQKQIETERMKLSKALQAKGMADREIATMLDKLHPLVNIPVDVQALIPSPESVTSENSRPSSKSSRRSGIWSRLSKSGRSSTSQTSSTKGEQAPAIPRLLQDPWAEDGVAELKAYYYQRMLGHQGERIRKVAVELPDQWLLQTLIQREESSRKDPGKFESIWRAFSIVPDDYRYFITNDLSGQPGMPDDEDSKWVLVYLDCVRADGKRRLLGRKRDDTIGVYVVMKKNRKARSRPDSNSVDNRGKSERDEVTQVVNNYLDVPTSTPARRRLSSRSRSMNRDAHEEHHVPYFHEDTRRSSSRRFPRSRSPSPEYPGHGATYVVPSGMPPPPILYGTPVPGYYGAPPSRSPPRRSRPHEYADNEYVPLPVSSAAVRGEPSYQPSPSVRGHSRPRSAVYEEEDVREREREYNDRYDRERTNVPHQSRGNNLSRSRYSSSYLPPQRQDSNDSYSGRKREVRFGDSPNRKDTYDSMDSRDSRSDYVSRQRRDDYVFYDERDRYHHQPHVLEDIEEAIGESASSNSGSSTSSDTEEEKELYGLDDHALQERILKEYTSPTVSAREGTDQQGGSNSDPVEQNKESNDQGKANATGDPVERTMTDSPAPLHPDGS